MRKINYSICSAISAIQVCFSADVGYVYRKNDVSVSWQYRSDSTENSFKIAYALKGWIEKKNKDPADRYHLPDI